MTTELALLACALIATAGTLIDAAEMLAARRAIDLHFEWSIIRTFARWSLTPNRLSTAVGRTTDARWARAFQGGRCVAAVLSVVGLAASIWWVAVVALAVTFIAEIVQSTRLAYGLDGADQMRTILWAGLLIGQVHPAAGLALIALQCLLAYVVAGTAKLGGPSWRAGTAPGEILATATHGTRFAARWCTPIASRSTAWLTIAFELGAPALVLAGPGWATAYVVLALGFHAGIAITMGLNNFVWSFWAALPAVVWMSQRLPWISG